MQQRMNARDNLEAYRERNRVFNFVEDDERDTAAEYYSTFF
jgi:hypothetical protein